MSLAPQAYPHITLRANPTVIGRKTGCDVRMTDIQSISSRHCSLSWSAGEARLRDLSTNGCLLNGKRLVKDEATELCAGDEVVLAKDTANAMQLVAYIFQVTNKSGSPRKRAASPVANEPPAKRSAPSSVAADDKMEEILICSICREIFHDCITLLPCLHNFCAGCYSGGGFSRNTTRTHVR